VGALSRSFAHHGTPGAPEDRPSKPLRPRISVWVVRFHSASGTLA